MEIKSKSIKLQPVKYITHLFLNIFIIFHLAAFAIWSCPLEFEIRTAFVHLITPYMLWSGLWQGWDMFSPDPLRVNSHLEALVTFRDGTQATWVFPRMDKLSYFDRYLKERYRKWSSSYVRLDAYSYLWADTARYVARNYYNPSNPPKEIKLKRFWMEIPPPSAQSIYQPLPKEFPHNQSYTFYTFQPQSKDFS